MRKSVLLVTIFLCAFTWTGWAQSTGGSFLSIHVGTLTSNHPGLGIIYGSRTGIVFGPEVGIAVAHQLKIYGKILYFTKSKNNSSLTQWLINLGLQYDVPISPDICFELQAGPTYSHATETFFGSPSPGSARMAVFTGLGLEKVFLGTPFSIFVEAQGVFTPFSGSKPGGNYGGFNASVGSRYYF